MNNQQPEESDDLKFLQEILAGRQAFWKEKYPTLTLEKRKKVWYHDVYAGIRRQPEESQNIYDAFSKKWYEFAKQTEPEFDCFFEEIIMDLKGFLVEPFDWEEYRLRISK